MKVTLRYDETDNKDLQMVLRLTLPQKYINGPCREVVRLFVDHYNKKHAEDQLEAEGLHLKIVGGDHLDGHDRVRDVMAAGDECYLLPEAQRSEKRIKPAAVEEKAAPTPAAPAEPSEPSAPSAPPKEARTGPNTEKEPAAPKKNNDGKVRCKNFGCQRWFDPDREPPECCHHKSAPIFHETAKWWSCCPDRKAYDWEEFMRIPGCTKGFCSATGAQGKRVLGGCDIRGDTAPERIDVDAPVDPRKKLDEVRKGLIAIGVDGALFEKVWMQLAADNKDMDKVVDQFRMRFSAVLNSV